MSIQHAFVNPDEDPGTDLSSVRRAGFLSWYSRRTVQTRLIGAFSAILLAGMAAFFIAPPVSATDEPMSSRKHAASNDLYALVANSTEGTVSVLSLATQSVIDIVTVGDALGRGFNAAPGCVAVTPDERWGLVTYERPGDHQLIVVALDAMDDGVQGNEIVDTVTLGQTNPEEGNCLAITPDGRRAYVVGGGNFSDIAVVDLARIDDGIRDNEVTWIDRADAYHHSIAITPDGTRAYITDNGFADALHVLDIDPASDTFHTVVASVDFGDSNTFVEGVAITPDGRRAYAVDSSSLERVYVVDIEVGSPTQHTIVDQINLSPLGDQPHQALISQDGRRLYVSRDAQVLTIDIEPQSATYHAIVARMTPSHPALWGLASMAMSPDHAMLLAVSIYQDSVIVYDLERGRAPAAIPVGDEPLGIALFRRPLNGPYALVTDEQGAPMAGVEVYRNGALDGISDARGIVAIDDLAAGDELAALLQVYEEPSHLGNHTTEEGEAGWAYRTYVTSLTQPVLGSDARAHMADDRQEQILALDGESVLILFNLVVSVRWNATPDYLDELRQAMVHASDLLYDVSDGQMALGRVTIADDQALWSDADIQHLPNNDWRPFAGVNGMRQEGPGQGIRLGRYWNGSSSMEGPWNQPDGYRTIVHELGHYALGIYDEYDDDSRLAIFCPMHRSDLPADDAANASIMYDQYRATELSALDVDGLWSPACRHTLQWKTLGESPWETLARLFSPATDADPETPAWRLVTPMSRGALLPGPERLPNVLPPWPTVDVRSATQETHQARQLLVLGPDNRPASGASVTLYREDGSIIDQGMSVGVEPLTVIGAAAGDHIRVNKVGTRLTGEIQVTDTLTTVIRLQEPVHAANPPTEEMPFLRMTPMGDPNEITLLVSVDHAPESGPFSVALTQSSEENSFAPIDFSPVNSTKTEGTFTLSANSNGSGYIRYADDRIGSVDSPYQLQQVANAETAQIFSHNGALRLRMEPNSLPGNSALIAVTEVNLLPGPVPHGKQILGRVYDITASNGEWRLQAGTSAQLKLYYNPELLQESADIKTISIYRWHGGRQVWEEIDGYHNMERHVLVADVDILDVYALLMSETPDARPAGAAKTFLPLVDND